MTKEFLLIELYKKENNKVELVEFYLFHDQFNDLAPNWYFMPKRGFAGHISNESIPTKFKDIYQISRKYVMLDTEVLNNNDITKYK